MKNPELKPVFKIFSNDIEINPKKEWLTILMPIDATTSEIDGKIAFHKWVGNEVKVID